MRKGQGDPGSNPGTSTTSFDTKPALVFTTSRALSCRRAGLWAGSGEKNRPGGLESALPQTRKIYGNAAFAFPYPRAHIPMNAFRLKSTAATSVLGVLLGLGLAGQISAQSVSTTPVGAVTVTAAAAPSASTPRYTSLALPLLNEAAYVGKVTGVTSNTITVDQAIGVSMNSSNPYFIRITSGVNLGLTLYINSNSGSTLTIDTSKSGALTALSTPLVVGASGDTFTIHAADTLSSLFGNAVLGGSSPSVADQVWLWQPAAGSYAKFYYNTTNSRWQDTDFDDPANNTVLLPDIGVMYMRRATSPVSFVLTGVVPSTNAKALVRNSGYTMLSTGFPTAITLNGMGLHNNGNWVKSSVFSTADQVWIWQPASGSYAKYFYNSASSRWEDSDFGDPAGSLSIDPQTPIMIKRSVTGQSIYTAYSVAKPYTL